MESKDFRRLLADMVKACGQELIDRADDLVGDGDLICDFSILLRFSTDVRMVTGVPTIEVTRKHVSKNAYAIIREVYRND